MLVALAADGDRQTTRADRRLRTANKKNGGRACPELVEGSPGGVFADEPPEPLSARIGGGKHAWPAVKRAMVPSRSRLPYYRVWATISIASRGRKAHTHRRRIIGAAGAKSLAPITRPR